VAVIGALLVLAVQFMRRAGADGDFIVIRGGMLIFAATALVDNLVGLHGRSPQIEPYGFVAVARVVGLCRGAGGFWSAISNRERLRKNSK
jgi:hypothetical protein